MTITSVPQARLTDHAALRLLCLPYAGGGTAVFRRWRSVVPASVDLVPIRLPGHDSRLTETPGTDLCDLAQELADDLQPAIDRSYVLFGYSLGGWLAFELARELRRRGSRMPAQLIVAAAGPPDTVMCGPPLHRLPDDDFIAAIQERYAAIPQAISSNTELLQVLLPVLRADIQMVETYRYAAEPLLDVDILALGGTEDPAISPAQLAEWRRQTSGTCSVRLFPGRHFFLFHSDNRQPQKGSVEPPTPALRTIITSIERYLHDINFDQGSRKIRS